MRFLRRRGPDDEDGPNLTPLIDIIFLLLVFLLLTTRFVTPESVIDALLPTQGGTGPSVEEIDEPPVLRLSVRPAALPLQAGRDAALAVLHDRGAGGVVYRADGQELLLAAGTPPEQAIDQISGFLAQVLQQREQVGVVRSLQDPVEIHCYSGFPWRYALWAMDGVRAYEGERFATDNPDRDIWQVFDSRPCRFAAPRLRGRDHRVAELMDLARL